MSRLNNSQGFLRGAKLAYTDKNDINSEWIIGLPVLGWVVYGKKGHKFDLNFDIGDTRAEIVLTRKALQAMLNAIDDEDTREPVGV